MLVVNAARKAADEAYLHSHLSVSCAIEPLSDRLLIALQGPKAEAVFAAFAPEICAMAFMEVRTVSLLGANCVVSRSGYTGEDGFEISVPVETAEALCERLLFDPLVAPVGLGARDSLRLETGLCLYGSDLDETTTPVEAALEWTISKTRREGGERAGGFPGAEAILTQLVKGAARRRVGLKPEGRAPVRHGTYLFRASDDNTPVGVVTSGGFSPSLNVPIAVGYVPRDVAVADTRLFAEVRSRRPPVRVSELPFVPTRYKRDLRIKESADVC
jgi:aminomethyltransferase